MKGAIVLLVLACLCIAFGVLGPPRALSPQVQQRLEHELEMARASGFGARLLVTSGSWVSMETEARSLAERSGDSVLALSVDSATIVPANRATSLGSDAAWAGLARHVTRPYFSNRDSSGAAAALVRAYSNELLRRGALPALPPLPPILLPDIEEYRSRPSQFPLLGMGLTLLVLGVFRMISRRVRSDELIGDRSQ